MNILFSMRFHKGRNILLIRFQTEILLSKTWKFYYKDTLACSKHKFPSTGSFPEYRWNEMNKLVCLAHCAIHILLISFVNVNQKQKTFWPHYDVQNCLKIWRKNLYECFIFHFSLWKSISCCKFEWWHRN